MSQAQKSLPSTSPYSRVAAEYSLAFGERITASVARSIRPLRTRPT